MSPLPGLWKRGGGHPGLMSGARIVSPLPGLGMWMARVSGLTWDRRALRACFAFAESPKETVLKPFQGLGCLWGRLSQGGALLTLGCIILPLQGKTAGGGEPGLVSGAMFVSPLPGLW